MGIYKLDYSRIPGSAFQGDLPRSNFFRELASTKEEQKEEEEEKEEKEEKGEGGGGG